MLPLRKSIQLNEIGGDFPSDVRVFPKAEDSLPESPELK